MSLLRPSWLPMSLVAVAACAIACGHRETSSGPAVAASSTLAPAPPAPSVDASADVYTHASPHDSPMPSAVPVEPVITDGSVDGAKLRARISARLASDKSPVVVLQGTSPEALGKAICEQVVPRRPAETPILIKPNIGGFDWFQEPADNGGDDGFTGRITNPEFVRGVIHCLQARGHTHITIADGWGGAPKYWTELMDRTGYGALARETAVTVVSFADDGHFDRIEGTPGKPLRLTGMERTRVPNLLMPKILAEHLERGLVISVPKLKAHRFAVMSGGIKGLQGTVMLSNAVPAYRQKWRMHAELQEVLDLQKARDPAAARAYVAALDAFAARMADTLAVEAPDVVLMDAAPAMGGDGFHELVPSPELVAVGGTNVIAVDRVGAELLGLWKNRRLEIILTHHTSPLITRAASQFGVDLSAVNVVGNGASLLDGTRATHFKSMGGFSIHSDSVPPRVAHAKHLAGDAIHVDGRADEAIWSTAEAATFSTDHAGVDRGIRTSVRFAWSQDALFVLWQLQEAGFNTDLTQPLLTERMKLHEEDCVELFLDTTPNTPQQYLEIQLGPAGHFHDVGVDLTTKAFDASWSGNAEVAVTQDRTEHTAIIEVAIRAPEVRLALRAGKRLPMGLFRMEGKAPRRYLAWSFANTAKPNFHLPEAFGTLVLDSP